MAIYFVFSSILAHSGIEKDYEDEGRGEATGEEGEGVRVKQNGKKLCVMDVP